MKSNSIDQSHSNSNFLTKFFLFLNGPLIKWFVIFAYGYFFAIILIEVLSRYLFNHSSPWGEMTARYAFVYFAYIASAEAFRHDEHIRIDYVPSILGSKASNVLETYIDILCIAISACAIWYSIGVMSIQIQANIRMHSLPINLSLAQAALPIGWSLMVIRILQRMYRRFGTQSPNTQTSEI